MNVQIEQLGAQHERVSIHIAANDYGDAFKKSLKDLAKKAQIKGFRPGHVPMGLVQKMYGDQALAEELNKLVNKTIDSHLKENGQRLLGDPLPADTERVEIDQYANKDYTFVYEIGLQPNFELGLSQADHFTWYRIPAKEEEISQELERLTKKYGKRDEVDSAEANDVVYVHLQELNEDGEPREDGLHVHSFFNQDMLSETGQQFFSEVTKDFAQNIPDLFSVFKGERDQIARNVLQLKDVTEEMVANIQPGFACKVERIVRLIPAELDAAFFDAVSAEYGEVADEASLRSRIQEIIENYNDGMTKVGVDNDIYRRLIDQTHMELPEAFLERWYDATERNNQDGEEETFPSFLRKLKESLIFRKVQSENEMEVSQEEVINEALNQIRSTYGQLGEDFVRYIAETQLKERSFIESMHDRVLQGKFLDVLRSRVTINNEATTLEDYQSLQKATANVE